MHRVMSTVSKQLLVNTGFVFRSCQSARVCTAYCWLLSGLTLRCISKHCLVLLRSSGFCFWLVHWQKQLLANFVVPPQKASSWEQYVCSACYFSSVPAQNHRLEGWFQWAHFAKTSIFVQNDVSSVMEVISSVSPITVATHNKPYNHTFSFIQLFIVLNLKTVLGWVKSWSLE